MIWMMLVILVMTTGTSRAFEYSRYHQLEYRWGDLAEGLARSAGCEPSRLHELHFSESRSHFVIDCRGSLNRSYVWCRGGIGDELGVRCGYFERLQEAGMVEDGLPFSRDLRYEAAVLECSVRGLEVVGSGRTDLRDWAVLRFWCLEDGISRGARCGFRGFEKYCDILRL